MKRFLLEQPERKRALIESSYNRAILGDPAHTKMWLDRIDGPVPAHLSIESMPDDMLLSLVARLFAPSEPAIEAQFTEGPSGTSDCL